MSVLELVDVSYRYPSAAEPALRRLSLRVEEGEFVLLAGASAAGKSTLLSIASGLVPHFHGGSFDGHAAICGRDLRSHGPAQLAADVGTLFGDPETQIVMGSVRGELAFPLENRGEPPHAVARGVEEVALALGIEGLLDRETATLSGGELQRVALGAALAGRPRLLVLDEPTSQLDPVAGDELISLLRRLNDEWGTTVMLAEHRLERCLSAADRVLVLDGGRIVCDAAPRAFLAWARGHAPLLQTPGASLIAELGLEPPPVGVKEAQRTLRTHGLLENGAQRVAAGEQEPPRSRRRRRVPPQPAALRCANVWHELRGGRAILAGVSCAIAPGELVALLGRNGAGKSTLLRHAAGLLEPTRGHIERAGAVALLLQHPGAYFLHDRVSDELPAQALEAAGLGRLASRHPRELSAGERQLVALAIVGADNAALLCLDEPTRGMDRGAKALLARELRARAQAGTAVLVATHDPEFAASFARRAILMGDGRVIADAPAATLLSGGWYFATETARILGGRGGALLPGDGVAMLRAPGERAALLR